MHYSHSGKLYLRVLWINVFFTEILLRELNAVSTQAALDNLCVKVWLFIQCALYSMATLKNKGHGGSPLN